MRTNFEMQNQNITMIKGDTLSFNAQIIDENDEPMTVDSAYFTCRKSTTSENVFRKSLGDGITQEDALLTIRVAPQDTVEADSGNYYYDFQIGIGEDIYTVMIGMLTIEQDVS